MVTDKMTFQGIPTAMVPLIADFFESAQVCSAIFESCTTIVNGKTVRSQDIAMESHKKMGLTVVFAGITAFHLNTQFRTFTLEISVIREVEIMDWKLREGSERQGYANYDGSYTLKIGCPKEIIDQIHRLLEIYGRDEIIR